MERWLADKNAKAKAGPAAAAADVTRRETMKETQPEPESKKRSLLAPLTGLCILALGALAASVYLGLIQL